jgi:CheY-like chemotaxis protein
VNILYVEDDAVLRYSIARELRNLGHVVNEAEDTNAALALLSQNEIDVLVTDVGLPGETGDVFAAEARSLRPDLRLVICTGRDVFNQRGNEDSGLVVLRKPFTLDALLAALKPR